MMMMRMGREAGVKTGSDDDNKNIALFSHVSWLEGGCHSSSGYGIWWGRAQVDILSGSELRGKLIYTDLDWIPAPELDIHAMEEVISLSASV